MWTMRVRLRGALIESCNGLSREEIGSLQAAAGGRRGVNPEAGTYLLHRPDTGG
jgi:hypothetical protein